MQVLLDQADSIPLKCIQKIDTIIHQQRQDLLELSTPVIKLMDSISGGTLDWNH